MPRPRLYRKVEVSPKSLYFKPRGIPMSNLEEINISHEEIEAINLKDYKKLDQIQAAKTMHTSQSTFQRILTSARNKIAESLVTGKALRIEKK